MIDTKTERLGLPLPHEQNDLDIDVLRIRAAFRRLDEFARATDDTLAARLAQAVAADDTIATLLLRLSAAELAQAIVDSSLTEHGQTLIAHAAVLERKIEDPPTAERRGAIRVGARLHLEAGENGETDVLVADRAGAEQAGMVLPDGTTTTVDENGLLSALGGNLLLNDEAWITASGTWIAPVTAWYEVLLINGGQGGNVSTSSKVARGGRSGAADSILVRLEAGEEVPVTIGAGAPGIVTTNMGAADRGGVTSFGGHTPRFANHFSPVPAVFTSNMAESAGAGPGGPAGNENPNDGTFYGAGGGAFYSASASRAGAGFQGAVRVRWHDPAKAAGALPQPALFSARRMAARAVEPATVNLYDPETGQGSVWLMEDAEVKLAEGLITEAAWQEICAQKAAEAHAAWLADPETVEERFAQLRAARDAKLAATDYLMAADYPLAEGQRAAIIAYRQDLRDLPAQAGAPWDGGGEATPWPEMPDLTSAES